MKITYKNYKDQYPFTSLGLSKEGIRELDEAITAIIESVCDEVMKKADDYTEIEIVGETIKVKISYGKLDIIINQIKEENAKRT